MSVLASLFAFVLMLPTAGEAALMTTVAVRTFNGHCLCKGSEARQRDRLLAEGRTFFGEGKPANGKSSGPVWSYDVPNVPGGDLMLMPLGWHTARDGTIIGTCTVMGQQLGNANLLPTLESVLQISLQTVGTGTFASLSPKKYDRMRTMNSTPVEGVVSVYVGEPLFNKAGIGGITYQRPRSADGDSDYCQRKFARR